MTSTYVTVYAAAALVILACPAVLLAASSPPAGRHRKPEPRLSWPALRVRPAVAASYLLFDRPHWSYTVSFNVPWPDSRWDEIAPGLFQGGHYHDELHKFSSVSPVIVRDEFDLVVSLYKEWGHGPADGVEDAHVSIPDGDLTAEQMAKVTALVPRIVTALGDGRKVLVRCLLPGSMVGGLVPTRIEENPEEVITHTGAIRKVTDRMSRRHIGDVLRISAQGILPLDLTPEHPLLVLRPYRTRSGRALKWDYRFDFSAFNTHWATAGPEWVEAGLVREGDYLLAPKMQMPASDGMVPFSQRPHRNARRLGPVPLTRELAWMLGVYIADGGTMGDNSISIAVGPNDDLARIVAAFRYLGIEPRVDDLRTYRKVVVGSRGLRDQFVEWFGRGSHEKQIPSWLYGPHIYDVLDGIMAGDGYTNERRKCSVIQTTSLVLAHQVWQLAVSLGLHPFINKTREGGGTRPSPRAGRPMNVASAWSVEWRESRLHKTYWRDGYYCMRVTGVLRYPYDGPVHNLEVDGDHSFLVNGAATHNCQAGYNRSGLVVALVLLAMGKTAEEAIGLIREKRSKHALCNDAFVEYIRTAAAEVTVP